MYGGSMKATTDMMRDQEEVHEEVERTPLENY